MYISWLNATVTTPRYQLVSFNRTLLSAGQTLTYNATIAALQMAVFIEGKGFIIEPGRCLCDLFVEKCCL